MTDKKRCNLCSSEIEAPVYSSETGMMITSLCALVPGRMSVYFCSGCSHLLTASLEDVGGYYDKNYDILMGSEEEDDLYGVVGGKKVFRTEHQVNTLLDKMEIPPGASVLDYGCAKGAVLKEVLRRRPDLKTHFFDVSERHVDSWSSVVPEEQWATYELPDTWEGRFDIVTSFFVLEHVEDPVTVLKSLKRVLKPGGKLYFLVPDVYQNPADFVVCDHINHFSRKSISAALAQAGFGVEQIDETAHASAFVISAIPDGAGGNAQSKGEDTAEAVRAMGAYWNGLAEKIREDEAGMAPDSKAVIYGAGFYGTFIATCLRDLSKIAMFVDQSPFRQGKEIFGKRIVAPEETDSGAGTIFVGINPAQAREVMAGVSAFAGRKAEYFYL